MKSYDLIVIGSGRASNLNDIRELSKMIHTHPALPEMLLTAANAAIQKVENQK